MNISEEVMTKIMTYLSTRPFIEVVQLINDIQTDIKINNSPKDDRD